ncbi:MAG: hypothetical protein JXA95_04375 [Spirochaetales bacterium]|nr:hypothetical protein [Spirochaetales bacterium]
MMKNLIVGPDREFTTIQAALDSLGCLPEGPVTLTLKPGVYREKLRIMRSDVTLIGEDPLRTVITWDDSAMKNLPDGSPMGTFNSYTVYVGGRGFTGENLIIENSAGPGSTAGQAVAFYGDADRIHLKNCRLMGHQDTLCTGPLPVDPVPKGINPVHPYRFTDDRDGPVFHQLYEDCFICGDIDFIFGSAMAQFINCEIHSLKLEEGRRGFITAGSHPAGADRGYEFIRCRLTGTADEASVFLGRPWRRHAAVSFLDCFMGRHIAPEGWDNWSDPEREKTVKFRESGSSGPGALQGRRVPWAMTGESAAKENSSKNPSLL